MNTTTIQLERSLVSSLKNSNQYDEFLHQIQQAKTRELWDNNEDEEWQNA